MRVPHYVLPHSQAKDRQNSVTCISQQLLNKARASSQEVVLDLTRPLTQVPQLATYSGSYVARKLAMCSSDRRQRVATNAPSLHVVVVQSQKRLASPNFAAPTPHYR